VIPPRQTAGHQTDHADSPTPLAQADSYHRQGPAFSGLRRPGQPSGHPQTLIGTGKPAWQRITDNNLTGTIAALNLVQPQKVFLSTHETATIPYRYSLLQLVHNSLKFPFH